jgi:hypothetical protein
VNSLLFIVGGRAGLAGRLEGSPFGRSKVNLNLIVTCREHKFDRLATSEFLIHNLNSGIAKVNEFEMGFLLKKKDSFQIKRTFRGKLAHPIFVQKLSLVALHRRNNFWARHGPPGLWPVGNICSNIPEGRSLAKISHPIN